MSSKTMQDTNISTTEADELRVVVSELNESIAYLSKMVLQLQKSISGSRNQRDQQGGDSAEKPKTLH